MQISTRLVKRLYGKKYFKVWGIISQSLPAVDRASDWFPVHVVIIFPCLYILFFFSFKFSSRLSFWRCVALCAVCSTWIIFILTTTQNKQHVLLQQLCEFYSRHISARANTAGGRGWEYVLHVHKTMLWQKTFSLSVVAALWQGPQQQMEHSTIWKMVCLFQCEKLLTMSLPLEIGCLILFVAARKISFNSQGTDEMF